jgi:hypothetical protein
VLFRCVREWRKGLKLLLRGMINWSQTKQKQLVNFGIR